MRGRWGLAKLTLFDAALFSFSTSNTVYPDASLTCIIISMKGRFRNLFDLTGLSLLVVVVRVLRKELMGSEWAGATSSLHTHYRLAIPKVAGHKVEQERIAKEERNESARRLSWARHECICYFDELFMLPDRG